MLGNNIKSLALAAAITLTASPAATVPSYDRSESLESFLSTIVEDDLRRCMEAAAGFRSGVANLGSMQCQRNSDGKLARVQVTKGKYQMLQCALTVFAPQDGYSTVGFDRADFHVRPRATRSRVAGGVIRLAPGEDSVVYDISGWRFKPTEEVDKEATRISKLLAKICNQPAPKLPEARTAAPKLHPALKAQ